MIVPADTIIKRMKKIKHFQCSGCNDDTITYGEVLTTDDDGIDRWYHYCEKCIDLLVQERSFRPSKIMVEEKGVLEVVGE